MASLTQTSITARKVVRYSIYLVVLLIIARILFGLGKSLFKTLFPPPPAAPTVNFGKLPTLPLPETQGVPALEFKVETPEGGFPTLPVSSKVYFMPRPVQTQLNLDMAKEKIVAMSLDPNGTKLSQTLYQFGHTRDPITLKMNIITNAFSVSYDLGIDPTPVANIPPPAEIASANARSFLSSADLLPLDIEGPLTHEFFKIEAGSLVPVLSRSEANLIKINFHRSTYDDLPSVTTDPTESNIWFMVSGASQRTQQIIAGEYHYLPVDETVFETYPLKTAETALQELAEGKGYIANYSDSMGNSITIRRIYLAYFDPEKPTEFFQPVIVFEGDQDFRAYVPAVTAEYYSD